MILKRSWDITRHVSHYFQFSNMCAFFFQRVSGAVVVLLTSLVSFVASTRLIRLEVGAIDTPNQSCQSFEQYGASEVLENFSGDFSMACRQNMLIFSIFKAFIGTFGYYNLCQRKLTVISWKKYALHILILPLEFSLEIHKDEQNLHESPPKNLESVSKNEGYSSSV